MICADCVNVMIRKYRDKDPEYHCLLDMLPTSIRLESCSRRRVGELKMPVPEIVTSASFCQLREKVDEVRGAGRRRGRPRKDAKG